DFFQLTGQTAPEGARLNLMTDYMSRRGPAGGLNGEYRGVNDFGEFFTMGTAFYVNDHGDDNLGFDRRSLAPQSDNRGRVLLRGRQEFKSDSWFDGSLLVGEVGYLSDRN